MDSRLRSIAKSVSWRVIATFTTIIIVYVLTGKLALALLAGGLEVVIKLIIFYFHERVWNTVKFGVKK